MSQDPNHLDDVIRRASESNAAEPIRELTDDEMNRVNGASAVTKTSIPGAPRARSACSGGTICVLTGHTDWEASVSACCVKLPRR